jgi:hypothetical protein
MRYIFYFLISLLFIFLSFSFKRNIGPKCVSLASMVTPGSPAKKPQSAVASNLSKAFKGASFAGIKSSGARNAALEKEGELFVQVLYPVHQGCTVQGWKDCSCVVLQK